MSGISGLLVPDPKSSEWAQILSSNRSRWSSSVANAANTVAQQAQQLQANAALQYALTGSGTITAPASGTTNWTLQQLAYSGVPQGPWKPGTSRLVGAGFYLTTLGTTSGQYMALGRIVPNVSVALIWSWPLTAVGPYSVVVPDAPGTSDVTYELYMTAQSGQVFTYPYVFIR
jgi:hypothetical protein